MNYTAAVDVPVMTFSTHPDTGHTTKVPKASRFGKYKPFYYNFTDCFYDFINHIETKDLVQLSGSNVWLTSSENALDKIKKHEIV